MSAEDWGHDDPADLDRPTAIRAARSQLRPMPDAFQVKAVGVSFRPGYPESLHELAAAYEALPRRACPRCGGTREVRALAVTTDSEGDLEPCGLCDGRGWMPIPGEASLVRDAENEHDANAVAVLTNGAHVGYLPRELAARVGPELDAGARFLVTSAEVLIDPNHPDRPGLLLRVERAKEQA